jgi:hypothetical protein
MLIPKAISECLLPKIWNRTTKRDGNPSHKNQRKKNFYTWTIHRCFIQIAKSGNCRGLKKTFIHRLYILLFSLD